MKHSSVTKLFRYRSWKDIDELNRELDLMKRQRVWCTTPDKLNDPFDFKLPIITNLNPDERKRLYQKSAIAIGRSRPQRRRAAKRFAETGDDQMYLELVEDMQNRVNRTRVCCFASDAVNQLMWSYYANSHEGMCIEFQRHSANNLGNDEVTRKVDYIKEKNLKLIDMMSSEPGVLYELDQAKKVLEHTFFHKSEVWEHEQEFRFLAGDDGNEIPSPGEIIGVTFGLRMGERDRRHVATVLGKNFDYWEAIEDSESFEIKRRWIEHEEIAGKVV